ncbi:Beta-lactamase-like protein 2 [Aphelenchoides besseyi]|nr:Beta-lactamase-like protein 2 [Aphelenchoides besseyi]
MARLVALTVLILVVGWFVDGTTEKCSGVPGKKTIDVGDCMSGSGKLKVDGDELNFKVLYNKNGPGEPKKITLTVGKCLMTFDISPYSTPFPVPIKLDADGYTVGAKLFQCADYNPSSTEKVVEFNFTSEKTFPGLEIEFENAIVYEVPESESEWSLKSWRFWLSISAGIASFILLLSAISGCIWCSVKLKDDKKKNKKKALAHGNAVPVKASKKKQPVKVNQSITPGGIQLEAKNKAVQANKLQPITTAKPLINLNDKQTAAVVHEIINEEFKEVNAQPAKVVKKLKEEVNPPKPVEIEPPSVAPAPEPEPELPNRLVEAAPPEQENDDSVDMTLYPSKSRHGKVIENPHQKITEYIAHRLKREEQIVEALERMKRATPMDFTNQIYTEVPCSLKIAALENVKHHLTKLRKDGRIREVSNDTFEPIHK